MAWRLICPGGHEREVSADDLRGDISCPMCRSADALSPRPRSPGDSDHSRALAASDTCHDPTADVRSPDSLLAPVPEAPDIPGYTIIEEIGRGGMGAVYRARQHSLNRIVALKVVLSGPHAREEERMRFRIEAEAAARLRHPNIVQIHEVGEAAGRPFLVMEIVEGGSLAQQQSGAPLPPRTAAEFITTLADAIHFAHQQGIVHRDLKPANILLGDDGRVASGEKEAPRPVASPSPVTRHPSLVPKITDFGLAKRIEADLDLTGTGQILGTPAYMAPEQASGLGKNVGPAADVYALGAILYELLTGRPPFRAAGLLETLEQVRSQEPVAPSKLQPGLPRDLQTICLKCLEKEPPRRYAFASELADDLRRYLRGEPITARAVGTWERLVKWSRRKPAAAALSATATLAIVAFIVGLYAHNRVLQAQFAESQRQKAIALENFQRGYDVLEQLGLELAHESRRDAKSDRSQRMLHRHWQRCLAFYRDALRDADLIDPEARMAKASAMMYAGAALVLLDQPADGLADLQTALSWMEELVARNAENIRFRRQLSRCYASLGLCSFALRRFDEAERFYKESVAGMQTVLDAEPDFPRALANQAETYYFLSGLYAQTERWPEVEPPARAAIELYRKLIAAEPAFDDHRLRLADVYGTWVVAMLFDRRSRDIAGAMQEVEETLRPLAAEKPPHLGALAALGKTYRYWGRALSHDEQPEAALEKFAASIARFAKAIEIEPQHEPIRSELALAYRDQAWTLSRSGRDDEAFRAWDAALQYAIGSVREAYELERATELARVRHDVATRPQSDALRAAGESVESARICRINDRFDEAESLLRRAESALRETASTSDSPATMRTLADMHYQWAELEIGRGSLDAALERYDESIRALTEVVAMEPNDKIASAALAFRLRLMAWHLSRAARMDEAFAAWDRAIRHAAGNEREYYRTERALERAIVGAYEAATLEADQVASTRDLPDLTILQLARVYSRAIEAVARDRELSAADRDRFKAAYSSRAIACLQRIEMTYLADPERLDELESDDALTALRDRDAFRKWRDGARQVRGKP